jgi:hypothetical protein
MAVNGAAKLIDRLQLWMIGEPVRVDSDWQGLEEALPRSADLFYWIEDPARFPDITADVCARVAKNVSYCSDLAGYLTTRPPPQRERFCHSLKDRSAELAAGVGSALAASSGGSSAQIAALLFAFPAVLLVFIAFDVGGWTIFAAAALVAITLVFFLFALRDRRRNKELAAGLCK